MSAFEDHLWSELLSDHGEQMRRAGKATAALAGSLAERDARRLRPTSGSRPDRRRTILAASTIVVACLATMLIVAHAPTRRPAGAPVVRTGFAITDNRDGTLTVTLRNRSALPLLNAQLARYRLQAKLPGDLADRTLSLIATCPRTPTLPSKGHPLRLAPAGTQPAPLPGTPRPLKICLLHTP